jgi:hypothetical protein
MERERYLRLLREGHELAFVREDLGAGVTRYAEALESLAPGDLAYSAHYGEYATVLRKLGRVDDALTQSRLAVQAAMRESGGDAQAGVVALERYALGELLVAMGRPGEALDAVTPSLETRSTVAPLLMVVQVEALAALGRLSEARVAAALVAERASDKQRPTIEERLGRVLPDG